MDRNSRILGGDYREHLHTAVGSSAAPYGYTLATWTTGAVLTHAYGIPATTDALLFMGKVAVCRGPVPAGSRRTRVQSSATSVVVEGPYRYVRNPLYVTDLCLIVGATLLTRSVALAVLAVLYMTQLALQLPLEERELRERFGLPYRRYCELVPRFIPRRTPLRQRDLHS